MGLALLSSRRLLDFIWIALAVFGLWLLLPTGQSAVPLDPVGMGLALAAGLCWALYIVFGQKAGAEHGKQTVALGTIVAALLVFPIGLWQAGGSLFAPDLLPIALTVAVLSSALPYSLEMVALTRLPARTFSTLMSMEPAIAALSGLLFLSERLTSRSGWQLAPLSWPQLEPRQQSNQKPKRFNLGSRTKRKPVLVGRALAATLQIAVKAHPA